jgi:hypothetical protein
VIELATLPPNVGYLRVLDPAKGASVSPPHYGSFVFQALFDGILTKAVYPMPVDIISKAFLFGFYFGLFF